MKSLLLYLLFFLPLFALGQNDQIQILLRDEAVGYPIGNPTNGYAPVSNDAGLNAIFLDYNANAYNPGVNGVPGWENRTHFVVCFGCDMNAFEQALLDYSTVIEKTWQGEWYIVANALHMQLIDIDNGSDTGNTSPEGVIITNNPDLNTIFEDFTVLGYEQTYPSSTNPDLLRVMSVWCDCYATDLAPVLLAQPTIVEHIEYMGYVTLGLDDFELFDVTVYPNPVSDYIEIKASTQIHTFEMYDLLGKRLFSVSNENELNERIQQLTAGNYFLSLESIDGLKEIKKIIKQ